MAAVILAAMTITVPASDRTISITATGGETEIPLPFPVLSASDVTVTLTRFGADIELMLGAHYSVSGVGAQTGAKVILVYPSSPNDVLTVDGNMAPARETYIAAANSITSGALNLDIIRLFILLQEARRDIGRLLTGSAGSSGGGGGGGDLIDAELIALSSLPSAADTLPYFTAPGLAALAAFTQKARDLLACANATAMRAVLAVKEDLSGNRTYYVRPDGNDFNDGLSNSAAGAFLTIQKAYDVAKTINLSGYTVTISVADGTYTAGTVFDCAVNGNIEVVVNISFPANCVINGSANVFVATNGATIRVKGFKCTTTSGHVLFAEYNSILERLLQNFRRVRAFEALIAP